jgi:hypothetical protein
MVNEQEGQRFVDELAQLRPWRSMRSDASGRQRRCTGTSRVVEEEGEELTGRPSV